MAGKRYLSFKILFSDNRSQSIGFLSLFSLAKPRGSPPGRKEHVGFLVQSLRAARSHGSKIPVSLRGNGWPVSMSSDRLEGLSTNPSAGRILGISHEIWNPKDHTSITRSYYAISDLQQHGWPVPQYMTYRQSLKRNMSLDGSWDARFRLQTIRLERNIAH